jgi:hypothetical protein
MRIGVKDIIPLFFFAGVALSPAAFEHFGHALDDEVSQYIVMAGGLGLLYFTLSLLTKTGR